MDVVEWKDIQDAVVRSPSPGIDEGRDLGLDIGVGCHDTLGTPGRPACVKDHRGPVYADIRKTLLYDRVFEKLRGKDEPQPASLGYRPKPLRESRMGHDRGRIGVVDRVFELGIGMRYGERDRYSTRPPDAPLHGHELEAGRREKGDPGATEIDIAGKQAGRNAGRAFHEDAIREGPRVVNHGGAVAMECCSPD